MRLSTTYQCAIIAAFASTVSAESACVKMHFFKDQKRCKRKPNALLVFPVPTEEGSPCFRTEDEASGMVYHVKNQYCDVETGKFYQEVYWDSAETECNGEALPQTFSADECMFGVQLKEKCRPGPCDEESWNSQ